MVATVPLLMVSVPVEPASVPTNRFDLSTVIVATEFVSEPVPPLWPIAV